MSLDQLVLDLIAISPVDAVTLRRSLPEHSAADIDAALARLLDTGAVERAHVQTLPPRVLYRTRGVPPRQE